MKLITKLPSLEKIKKQIPLDKKLVEKIKQDRQEIKNIILWKDDRKLIVVWPCSVDFEDSILDYARRLKKISDKVQDKYKIVMRTYTAKPRTTIWWKGVLYNGELGSKWNLADGVVFARKLMKQIIQIWLAIADEMLYPELIPYFDDILSYVAIWARSSENQSHREVGSGLDIALGVKNPTSGDLQVTVNSLIATRSVQQALLDKKQYRTEGNPYAHILLRGSNFDGLSKPNLDKNSIEKLKNILNKKWIKTKIIIDLNHDNSAKNGLKQPENMKKLLEMKDADIVGYMIESYIYDGNQKLDEEDIWAIKKGLSVTDHCLGIEKLEKMLK